MVNVASLAGKGGVPYEAVYATTKAGLVGFTRSLRAELEGTPVGASAICPGFVAQDGMYARMEVLGIRAPLPLRPVAPEAVTAAVISAIEGDRPEVLVSAVPVRPLLVLQELAPRLAERATAALGMRRFFRAVIERQARA